MFSGGDVGLLFCYELKPLKPKTALVGDYIFPMFYALFKEIESFVDV